MNARFYVAGVGRFLSPDTIVPELSAPQSLNRYSYVQNNPVVFTDPSGHCRYNADGQFEYAEDCTVEEYDKLSWDDRIRWMQLFMDKNSVFWFHNIIGILEFFRDDAVFSDSRWASWSDAGVLAAIQDGWRASNGETPVGTGGDEWELFFRALARRRPDSELLEQWGVAEQSGVDYGVGLAERFVADAGAEEQAQIGLFVAYGDLYRALISGDNVLHVSLSDWVAVTPCHGLCAARENAQSGLTSWAFDPRRPSSATFVRIFSAWWIVPSQHLGDAIRAGY